MKLTQSTENGISESSDFQNFVGGMPLGPPNNILIYLHQIFSTLSLIRVQFLPCDQTVSCKKLVTVIVSTLPKNVSNTCNCCLSGIGV